MKITAIIEDFNCPSSLKNYIQTVRRVTGADAIIAIMPGDFTQQGLPAAQNKYLRARSALALGIDLVIELPVYCTLTSPDTYAFAAVSALEKLGCIDELAIRSTSANAGLLARIAMFLFAEPLSFQQKIRALRHEGLDFYTAQAQAVGAYIPDSAAVLSDRTNIFAVEYARAIKRMYSTIKPTFVFDPSKAADTAALSRQADQYIYALLRHTMAQADIDLNEIFGGTSMLTSAIQSICKDGHYTSFNDFAKALATPIRSAANIRRYLLSLLLNIKKSDMAICRLYNFALYGKILAENTDSQTLIKTIQEKAGFPVLSKNTVPLFEPSKQHLLDFDQAAHQLYQKMSLQFH